MSTNERWDTIVIGGGAGGVATAAYLAAAGKRTLLLEQYDVVGGSSHVFRRKGEWEFDVGIHYFGDCGPQGQLPSLLRGLGLEDRIEFLEMDRDGFDTMVGPDMEIRVPHGWDRYLETMIDAFPADQRGLRKMFGIMIKIGEATDRSLTPGSARGAARMALDAGPAMRWAMRPLNSLMDACKLSPRARGALSAYGGAYGCPPGRAPVALHASFLDGYVRKGAWFPRGGGQVIAANLIDVIHSHGGKVRTQARVERILIEGGRAVGVRLDDGETLRAASVVSDADVRRTYLELVGREHLRGRTVRRVEHWRMTAPFVNLYLGVEVDLRDRIPNTNYYSAPSVEDADRIFDEIVHGGDRPRQQWLDDAARNMPAFVHCSTVKDPDNPRCAPAGCSSLEVMAPVPGNRALWSSGNGDNYRRDSEYLEMKERMAEMLLDRAEFAIKGLKDVVAWKEVSTPLTQERYTRSSGGTAYGLEPNTRQFGPFRPGSRTEIGGLFLAGTSTAWGPGVEGSMISGMHAAGAVLGRDLAREVHAGAVIADPSRLSPQADDWDPLMASKRLSKKREERAREVAAA